ncbi:hypothetical protein Moror_13677 [Moniliophthora roreri MCA 2997]|uniref:Uncharacterized protein n=1 Tax=Moniliophthora roreri (strain MCA 2997) TaxID=1381753 RepID=V2XC53_MONRO|nr:hypothetical protein Moror_13677 [Moniliophthora roreri MCA 2997]
MTEVLIIKCHQNICVIFSECQSNSSPSTTLLAALNNALSPIVISPSFCTRDEKVDGKKVQLREGKNVMAFRATKVGRFKEIGSRTSMS